jgi:hypothetical protein
MIITTAAWWPALRMDDPIPVDFGRGDRKGAPRPGARLFDKSGQALARYGQRAAADAKDEPVVPERLADHGRDCAPS